MKKYHTYALQHTHTPHNIHTMIFSAPVMIMLVRPSMTTHTCMHTHMHVHTCVCARTHKHFDDEKAKRGLKMTGNASLAWTSVCENGFHQLVFIFNQLVWKWFHQLVFKCNSDDKWTHPLDVHAYARWNADHHHPFDNEVLSLRYAGRWTCCQYTLNCRWRLFPHTQFIILPDSHIPHMQT